MQNILQRIHAFGILFFGGGVSIQDYKIPIYTKVRENAKLRNL